MRPVDSLSNMPVTRTFIPLRNMRIIVSFLLWEQRTLLKEYSSPEGLIITETKLSPINESSTELISQSVKVIFFFKNFSSATMEFDSNSSIILSTAIVKFVSAKLGLINSDDKKYILRIFVNLKFIISSNFI